MANYNSSVQKFNAKNDENVERFPYRVLNDLSKKLKVAEATIANMLAERESNRSDQNLPTLRDQSQQTWSPELVNRSQQTAPATFVDDSVQTPAIPFTNLSVKTELIDEELGPDSSEVALQAENDELKKKVAELVFENNRYHLAITNCTFCASDDAETSDVSSFDAPSRASTPVPSSLPSSDPALQPSPIPSLMSLAFEDRRQAEVKTVEKSKDRTFISRMIKTLAKLETKYQVPEHKRKKRLFVRKQKTSPIIPREFATIYNALAVPEPDTVTVPEPFPHVRWNEVRFKPALPTPESCPVHSCSPDPEFYAERDSPSRSCNFAYVASQNGKPFGALPGYLTSRGVVALPTTPVGGYVYCPEAEKWVLFAEPHSSPASTGRGTRRGGGTPPTRRRMG